MDLSLESGNISPKPMAVGELVHDASMVFEESILVISGAPETSMTTCADVFADNSRTIAGDLPLDVAGANNWLDFNTLLATAAPQLAGLFRDSFLWIVDIYDGRARNMLSIETARRRGGRARAR